MTTAINPVCWARSAMLDPTQRDCVTAIVLKVLDAKCKMTSAHQEAILAIYDTLEPYNAGLFNKAAHTSIEQARSDLQLSPQLLLQIHQLRIYAEANIPKPTMKAFKARLRNELFEAET